VRLQWLADAARLTGYPVVEVGGWRGRGTELRGAEVVVCHHTAGPRTGEMPSLAVLRDGRPGLPGPLAQLGLGRSGTVYVIADGRANHAGTSSWAGFSSLNNWSIGIEAEDDGDGSWTPEQLDCYPRLAAALLHHMRRPAARIASHREVAVPAGRKIDPTGIDMNAFRARVAELLADPLRRIPRGGPPPATPAHREDDATVQIDLTFYRVERDGGTGDDRLVVDPAGPLFRGSGTAEVGNNSVVIDSAWVRWAAHWGWARWRIVFWDGRGPIAEVPDPGTRDYWPVPAGCRSFTVEGEREHAGVTVAATLLQRPK
jgi:hypothetical protein